jgi:Mrp family chromosome partitioning ATPase
MRDRKFAFRCRGRNEEAPQIREQLSNSEYGVPSIYMSKNFELLRQIANEEELFQAACQSMDVVSAKNGNFSPDVGKEAREKILRNASLPDVLRTASGTSSSTPAVISETNTNLNLESGEVNGQKAASAGEFRNSRNPSSPIGVSTHHAEHGMTQRTAKSDFQTRTFGAGKKPRVSFAAASRGSLAKAEKETPRRDFAKFASSLPWIDGISTAARGWGRRLQANNNRHGMDVGEIAREEEIKLVQRVFPGTDRDSARIALFAGLEGEAGCAAICARAGEILAARAEGPVCVVDANFRWPSLHSYFGVENEKGLVEATFESGPIQSFVQQIPEPDLWLMPSGKAAANLRFPAMADGLRVRIAELRETFRYVVIHSGPLRLETSAMLLSRWTDGVVLVLEANSTRRDAARRVKDNLVAAGVSVLGVVLNNRAFPIPEAIYRRL